MEKKSAFSIITFVGILFSRETLEMYNWFYGSNPPDVFLRKGIPKIWSKCTGEHPCHSEITLWQGGSPVNLLHIFRTPIPKNTSGGLLQFLSLSWNSPLNKVFKSVFILNLSGRLHMHYLETSKHIYELNIEISLSGFFVFKRKLVAAINTTVYFLKNLYEKRE